MKKSLLIMICLLMVPSIIYAEAVFLKDGSIVEGKIVKETDKSITIKYDETVKTIPRNDVLRVLFNDTYNKKVYIFMKDNSVIEGYVVEEDRDSHVYRKNLTSPDEKRVKKDDIRFISDEKISIFEMQMKSGKPKLIAERQNKFLNMLGLRLGYMHSIQKMDVTANSTTVPMADDEISMMDIGLYYYARFFEFTWDMFTTVDSDDANLHQYIMNFIPFSLFNVDLGIGIGYNQFHISSEVPDGGGVNAEMTYDGLLLGLNYRWGGWFRIGFYYVLILDTDISINFSGTSYDFDKMEGDFNCYAYAEVIIWSNLSIIASYRYTNGWAHRDEDTSSATPEMDLDLENHSISVSVSFGINLF